MRQPLGNDIYGQLLNANGTLYGGELVICNFNGDQSGAKAAYDSANQRFLVVWQDQRNNATTGYDIYGQLLNSDGTPNGGNFGICNADEGQYSPDVAYDSANQRFLAVWSDGRNTATTNSDVYGQFIDANGSLSGGDFVVNAGAGGQYYPRVAYNSVCLNFLVTYWASIEVLGYAVVGPPCAGAGTAIPSLSEWGILILIGIVGIGSVYYLRRHRLSI